MALCAFFALAATAGPRTQSFSMDRITLAWDRNRDSGTIGYYVHVGVASGEYTQRYDAGNATGFTYRSGVHGRRYFFAVSGYDAAGTESELSNEISAVFGTATATATASESFADPASRPGGTMRVRAEGLGTISSLSPLPDGRVLLVESARYIRLIDARGLSPDRLFTADGPETALTEVLVTPTFGQTGLVLVGMTSLQRDSSREFRVVRYRLVGYTLGEGATIVGGLSFRGEHAPRFDIDDTGHILVAMPSRDGARADPYAGQLLRFAPDGSVPDGQPGFSPVIASAAPIPLDVDAHGDDVWVVGVDGRGQASLGTVRLSNAGREWPRRIVTATFADRSALGVSAFDVSAAPGAAPRALMIDTDGGLYRVSALAAAEAGVRPIPWTGDTPVDVALTPEGTAYVVTKSTAGRFSVFQLQTEP